MDYDQDSTRNLRIYVVGLILGLVIAILGLLYAPTNNCQSATVEIIATATMSAGTVIAFLSSIGTAFSVRERNGFLSLSIVLIVVLGLIGIWAVHGFLLGLCAIL